MSRDANRHDPAEVVSVMRRMMPYLPKEFDERHRGKYPAIDEGGALAARLAATTLSPDAEIEPGLWRQNIAAVLPAIDKLLGDDIMDFWAWANAATASILQRVGTSHPRSLEIAEIFSLFGPAVAKDVGSTVAQLGYSCALGRVLLDPNSAEALGPIADHDTVVGVAKTMFDRPPQAWVGLGLAEPLSEAVVVECLSYVCDEFYTRLRPLIDQEAEPEALVRLRSLALRGFGIGRLHVEPSFPTRIIAAARGEWRTAHHVPSIESFIPPDARVALESAGVAITFDAASRSMWLGLRGFALARIDTAPPGFEWSDASLGEFLRTLAKYERAARALQKNGSGDALVRRDRLRSRLAIDRLLAAAAKASCTVERKGGLTAKDYYLAHVALGTFARARVFRGQSHVAEVAFSSPTEVAPLQFLLAMEQRLSAEDKESFG